MRFNSMFHVITFLTVSLIFSAPLMVLAESKAETTPERSVRDQATRDAQRDVERDVNGPMWFIIPWSGVVVPLFL